MLQLYVYNNLITDAGALGLAAAAGRSRALVTLEVHGQHVSEEGKRAVRGALGRAVVYRKILTLLCGFLRGKGSKVALRVLAMLLMLPE